jgi:hypothetical protein
MNGSHCQVVARTLAGQRPIDEQTHVSLSVLADRLERLRSHGGLFSAIEFSPHVQKLKQRCEPVSVG